MQPPSERFMEVALADDGRHVEAGMPDFTVEDVFPPSAAPEVPVGDFILERLGTHLAGRATDARRQAPRPTALWFLDRNMDVLREVAALVPPQAASADGYADTFEALAQALQGRYGEPLCLILAAVVLKLGLVNPAAADTGRPEAVGVASGEAA